jgi:hypothetical protein
MCASGYWFYLLIAGLSALRIQIAPFGLKLMSLRQFKNRGTTHLPQMIFGRQS